MFLLRVYIYSVLTDHKLELNHDFKWEDVEILDNESFLNKRLISEMLFIKDKNNLNLQTDAEDLYHPYLTIVT